MDVVKIPTVNLNKKTVLNLIGKKLKDDYLKDRISMLGTDLESVKEDEIVVEVFPNRPDMLSEQGFARALGSFIGAKTGLRKYNVNKSGEKVIVEKSVKGIRPYTAVAIVKGLALTDEKIREIIQIQEKLHVTFGRHRKKAAIGIYPYEKIKPPIRFVAEEPEKIRFQPLEYPKEITGADILKFHPTGREYGHLLEGLKKYPIFIDSNNQILSMPPIINSETVGKITETTKDVFIECSGFDFNVLRQCLNIIVTALAEMGGKIYSMDLIYPDKKLTSPDLKPSAMKLEVNYVNKLLGLNLNKKEIKKCLEKMGYGYDGKVLVPAYRADILHPIDIVEDIAIAYGYENFREEIPNVSTIGEESKEAIFSRKISEIAVGFGLLECQSYHLANREHLSRFMRKKDENIIATKNALNAEYTALRNALLPGLLKILSDNTHNEYPQRIFEAGRVIKPDPTSETGTRETPSMSVVIADTSAEFSEIKAILEGILANLGIMHTIKEASNPAYIDGRCAEIVINKKSAGFIGEIHPEVLNNFNLEVPVCAFEIEFDQTSYA